MTGKEVRKWADEAMFEAEPIDRQAGPQVQLLACNNDPLGSIAAAAKAYKGEFVTSLAEITDDERRHYLGEMQKTILAMPLESVHFQFHISGVTRAFTHQMVRQRTAAYSQESMRFAVKDGSNLPVGYPPSFDGTSPWDSWYAECAAELYPVTMRERKGDWSWLTQIERLEVENYAEKNATAAQLDRRDWDAAVAFVGEKYDAIINRGFTPAEDARGLVPTNVLTQINYHTNLRNFVDEGGKRLCTQAQFEWRLVFSQMMQAIRDYGQEQTYIASPYWQDRVSSAWQFDAIADLFRPVCYLSGKCGFGAEFDRKCKIRSRVQAFADAGIPSNGWHSEGWVDAWRDRRPLLPIEPAEWLLDPTAAR